jgi:hypothetical protein
MDFNSFYQIELYLDRRILAGRFYILGSRVEEWGSRGAEGQGENKY